MADIPEPATLEPRPPMAAVRAQLERLLASPRLASAPRLATFLRFVVAATLASRAATLKQYTIATEALGRDPSFDPRSDPFVRILAGRLRRVLADHYREDGRGDPVRIEIPRGTYVPNFHFSVSPVSTDGALTEDPPASPAGARPPTLVVLPFTNQGGDPAQDYLATGLGEELSLALCQFPHVRVVAHYSALSHPPGAWDLAAVGKGLGATFAIGGSLRSGAGRIRWS